ncbi:cell wall-binding repeat-containing protein [Compostimonas suwonensis]|nr:cell wall-binding repeat-containing protein [Compostimonas suwonensis]
MQSSNGRGILLRSTALLAGVVIAMSLAPVAAQAATSVVKTAITDPQTVVSLTFDDSNEDQMAAVDIMDDFGMKGTFYTITGYVDAPGYFTRAQLTGLAASGHEIGSHTVTHPDMTLISPTEAAREACMSRATLFDWGFTSVTSFAYPYASINDAAETAVENCGYNSGRGLGDLDTRFGCSGCGYSESFTPEDPFYTRAADQVDSTWTLADLQNTVMNAENDGGGWVQLTFHRVCAAGCDTLAITPELFQEFAAWLAPRAAAENTVVKTVGQVIGGPVKDLVGSPVPPAPGPGVNGVNNPGLETAGVNGVPQCWSTAGFGDNTRTFTTVSPGRTGNAAEQLVVTNWASGDGKLLPTFDQGDCAPTVTPGHSYSLRAWYTSTVPTQFDVHIRNSLGAWTYWTSSPWFAASPAYTQAVWTTGPVPAGTTGISFGLNLFQNGQLTTDDYALYDTVGAPGDLVPATPTITGTAQVGSVLTAVPGTWAPPTATLAYQWLRGGADIAGATSATYTLTAEDAAAAVSVRVTGSAPGFVPASASATSLPTAVVAAGTITPGTPSISGLAKVGSTLTAAPGSWTPPTAALAYQWLRGGANIAGATSATYALTPADVATAVSVRVTGSAPGYATATATSTPTATVAPGTITPGTPVISGLAKIGAALTVTPGTWSPAAAFGYQWLRGGQTIAGATSASYTPVAADIAKTLSVRVTGTASGYTTATATSAPTAAVTKDPVVADRTAGSDRFATAVQVSKAYAPGVARVYVANGLGFADALSASPAAAHFDSPLLLTTQGSLPADVRAEIVRLRPAKIVVVGGTASVSDAVRAQLNGIAPTTRISGDDRYATSRAIALDAFGSSAATAYVASGANFPDALSASPAAAHVGGPVLLIPGGSGSLDAASSAALTSLGVTTAKIAGGTSAVSAGIEASLTAKLGATSVKRNAGADRYATAAAINLDAFSSSETVFLATGTGFADALVGAALAGWKDVPLYLTPTNCVDQGVLAGIERLGATKVTLFGGTSVLSPAVQSLTACR